MIWPDCGYNSYVFAHVFQEKQSFFYNLKTILQNYIEWQHDFKMIEKARQKNWDINAGSCIMNKILKDPNH